MTAECGTYSGYCQHRRRGEPTCAACRAANAAKESERRARKKAGLARPPGRPLKPNPLLEDIEHFRGFGWSDQRIADRLSLKLDTLQTMVRRQKRRANL